MLIVPIWTVLASPYQESLFSHWRWEIGSFIANKILHFPGTHIEVEGEAWNDNVGLKLSLMREIDVAACMQAMFQGFAYVLLLLSNMN